MIKPGLKFVITITLLITGVNCVKSQTAGQEVLDNGTLRDQMQFIEEKTRIYENYRAIREDMFQKIKGNSLDSLDGALSVIEDYKILTGKLNGRIDSLRNTLSITQENLDETTRTKERISVLGIGLNKTLYNLIMWIIVAGLLVLLGSGFVAFRRNFSITQKTRNELDEMKKEFDDYRTKTRLEREKASMEHFKEIQRLKGR
ncbi:MAG TPA: hypothetical protein PLV06_09290 [Bacteroidales bacterium]|nr:hypothetical protein [Bacteroidales bacterium]HPR12564.1 hypothetical protein [Bacteroidales bacterium]HRW86693.1 hypothetical protein [Bacteroidales bacterium]